VPRFLLDSDVIIEWLRGNEEVVDWIVDHDAKGDFLGWTPISVAEIYAGLRPREEAVLSDVIDVLHCVEIDQQVGRKAGLYQAAFAKSHGVEIADALIAAAAHAHGLTVCTRNLKHYPMRDLKKLRL